MAELVFFVVVGSLLITVIVRMIFQSLVLDVKRISIPAVSVFIHLGSGIIYRMFYLKIFWYLGQKVNWSMTTV